MPGECKLLFYNYLQKAHLRKQICSKHYTLNNEVSRENFFERKGFRIINAIVLQRKVNGFITGAH